MKTQTKPKMHYAWWITVSCCAMMITGIGINGTVQGIFLSPVSKSLNCGIGSLSFYMTIRSLVATAFIPLAARVIMKYDLRLVLSCAFTVQGLGLIIFGQLNSLSQFYIVGGITGAASAFIFFIPVPMLINNWFSAKKGTVLGIATSFSGVGGAVFAPVGNFIIQNFGWRAAYTALGVMGLCIVLPFTIFVIRRCPAEKALLPYGEAVLENNERPVNLNKEGITAKLALKMPDFYLIVLFAISVNLIGAFVMHLSAFTESVGFNATVGAMSTSLFTIGIIIGKLGLGFLSDKIGNSKAILLAATLGVCGITLFIINKNAIFVHFAAAFLLGICTALATLGPPLVIGARFGQKDYTKIFSYVSTACGLTSALGTTIYGYVYEATGSYTYNLVVLGLMITLGVFALMYALKPKPESAPSQNL